MKRFMNMTLAVAALTFAAGTVSAQTIMTAEIPFAFHVGKQLMQPGQYRVQRVASPAGNSAFALHNEASHRTLLALPTNQSAPSKLWKLDPRPKLSFRCSEAGGCQLAQLSTIDGAAYDLPTASGRNGDVRMAEIVLHVTRAD